MRLASARRQAAFREKYFVGGGNDTINPEFRQLSIRFAL